MNEFDFDVAVIGGGSGGYAATRTAAGAGLKTVVIEGGKEVGGLCILRGCMPTKALLYAADVIHLARHAGTWGIRAKNVGFDFAQVMARKNDMIKDFADDRVQQLTSGKFKFIRATARFTDPHAVALSTGETLTAEYFIISTGSVVSEPPLPSLREAGYLTSDDALRLVEPPKSLIVLGGGAVAVEFAQFFTRFDTQVTLIQRSERILRDFDTDAAAELGKAFRREGMAVFTNTRLLRAGREGDRKAVSFEHDGKTVRLAADEILFALGRTPSTSPLRAPPLRMSSSVAGSMEIRPPARAMRLVTTLSATSTMCACPAASKWVKWGFREPAVGRFEERLATSAAAADFVVPALRATTASI